jgi:hypothetical protein
MNNKKPKVLFWIETFQIHFGIAKSIIEKYDCEPYALIACSPKQKVFFDTQKLIKFKTSWNLRDNVDLKNHKLNMKNLKKFENNFSINLQKIIYADRFFYKYNHYYKFTDEEILSILEQELNFYNYVLDECKPDYVVMRIPEYQDIELFYAICKAKNIKILILSPIRFGNRLTISSDFDSPIFLDSNEKNLEIKSFEDLQTPAKEFSKLHDSMVRSQKSSIMEKFKVIKSLFSTLNESNINNYRDLGKTPLKAVVVRLKLLLQSFFGDQFLKKNAQTTISEEHSYAYFPLHVEPERTILRNGENFTDQISVIRNISQSLPIEMNLLVKEHHGMKLLGWRRLDFYKKILEMPKVKLIHPSVSNLELIQNSSLITTIAGSTAIEALFYKKPSIVFGEVNCSKLSCVFKIKNLKDLSEIIKKCLCTDVDLVELNQYVNSLLKTSFSCEHQHLVTTASHIFGIGGFFDNAPIIEETMKSFLEENKHDFDMLADEHIKHMIFLK